MGNSLADGSSFIQILKRDERFHNVVAFAKGPRGIEAN